MKQNKTIVDWSYKNEKQCFEKFDKLDKTSKSDRENTSVTIKMKKGH